MDGPVLVTGASGFAGRHLLRELGTTGTPLIGWHRPDRTPDPTAAAHVRWAGVDIRDGASVEARLLEARPACIFHCAGVAQVAESWQQTSATLEVNALGTHHLLRAVRRLRLDARVVVPSSALVYRPTHLALSEDDPIGPSTPYGLSKLAQELVALAGFDEGSSVLVARPFNHIGPGQDSRFSTSSFARQIALAEAGLTETRIHVGNLESRRDVTDVRDVVRAYRLIAERGTPGRVYNICSERAPSVRELLDGLLALARVKVELKVDRSRLRPVDNPVLLGRADRIRGELGWRPAIPVSRTLEDLLDHWRAAIASGRA